MSSRPPDRRRGRGIFAREGILVTFGVLLPAAVAAAIGWRSLHEVEKDLVARNLLLARAEASRIRSSSECCSVSKRSAAWLTTEARCMASRLPCRRTRRCGLDSKITVMSSAKRSIGRMYRRKIQSTASTTTASTTTVRPTNSPTWRCSSRCSRSDSSAVSRSHTMRPTLAHSPIRPACMSITKAQ